MLSRDVTCQLSQCLKFKIWKYLAATRWNAVKIIEDNPLPPLTLFALLQTANGLSALVFCQEVLAQVVVRL